MKRESLQEKMQPLPVRSMRISDNDWAGLVRLAEMSDCDTVVAYLRLHVHQESGAYGPKRPTKNRLPKRTTVFAPSLDPALLRAINSAFTLLNQITRGINSAKVHGTTVDILKVALHLISIREEVRAIGVRQLAQLADSKKVS
ncbi:hypothetical protein GN316_19405 [Xylophilus sp. Kf1]|nr:hypothetical protein [Xylophilus sp. Kf1]